MPKKKMPAERMFDLNANKGNALIYLLIFFLLALNLLIIPTPAAASFNDCAIDWKLFNSSPGFISAYTYKGQNIRDTQAKNGNSDPTHGQANVPPSGTDLASGVTTANPGPYTTPFFGYYDGGTPYDRNNPSTMNDDVIFFRVRVSGDPTHGVAFDAYHWNVLFDVDADGYKEYWIDLDGSYSQNSYDRLNILYDNSNNQDISNPDAPGVRVNYFTAYNTQDTGSSCTYGRSHTRTYPINDGTGDWYVEEQVPMTAFKDSNGNQVLYPDSPVAFVWSTGASNQDPLQKDWMMDLKWLSNADPITFGDIVIPDGEPIIEFTDSAINFVNSYTIGDKIYIYVKDPLAHGSGSIQVTVTDPATGDDETVTLAETVAGSGIFTNAGGGTSLTSTQDGTGNVDNDGSLWTDSGNIIYVSYTNSNAQTVTDQATMIAPCGAFIQFTRANGLPSNNFVLTNDVNTSDKLYVTVTQREANTDPNTQQTITVNLTGNDQQDNLVLTETGNNTGVFRNTTGLNTMIETPPVTPNDNLWEDVDGGTVTATYSYTCDGTHYDKPATAQVFVTDGGGRVSFTNKAGTQDVSLYTPGQDIYLKVTDNNACTVTEGGVRTVHVTLTSQSPSSSPDSEDVKLYETASGSGVFMNMNNPVLAETYAGSSVSGDNILSASNGDTLRVTYDDCNDGDTDPSNNNKTDTALYNSPSVLINEVLFYPDPNTCQTEYIELYNTSSQPVNVTGYRITDGDNFSYTIPQFNGSDILLGAGKKIYISIYDVVPSDKYDDATGTYFLFAPEAAKTSIFPSDELGDPDAGNSADQADQISLYDASGTIIDYVGWSATLTPSIDFLGDDSAAVARGIWQDDAFVHVSGMTKGSAIKRSSDGVDTNTPADWVLTSTANICETIITRASISSFGAFDHNGKVTVQWETSSEANTAGFYLLRQNDAGGYDKVNEMMLPAIIVSSGGGNYAIEDKGAMTGKAYNYKLLEIENRGGEKEHGPFTVKVSEAPAGTRSFSSTGREARKPAHFQTASMQALKSTGRRSGPFRRMLDILIRNIAGKSGEIPVTEDGLYSLDSAQISAMLGTPEQSVRGLVAANMLSLTNRGEEVAYTPTTDGTGIIFYGSAIKSVYTNDNIYLLAKKKGLRMDTFNAAVSGAAEQAYTFPEVRHYEKDLFSATGLVTDPEADYWFWDYVVSGYPGYDSKKFDFVVEGVAPSGDNATLTVTLRGATDSPAALDHDMIFSLNGTQIGEDRWDGTANHTSSFSFGQDLLREGNNTLQIKGVLGQDVPYSIVYINSFDVAYQRLYQATGNKLMFESGDNASVTITGFTDPDILILDVTDALNPVVIDGAHVLEADGGYELSLSPSPSRRYLAVSRSAIASPPDYRPVASTARLRKKNNRADYLLITPPELEDAAASLADYRKGQGYETVIVDLEDIMNEFNFGIYNPKAIRDFLAFAYGNWAKAPRYVVLVGKGSYDYKNNLGYGENLMPSVMVGTPDGLFPSDNSYADFDGDHVPEMAVGRLPVVDSQGLQDLTNKIISYESTGDGPWKKRSLIVADTPEVGADFVSESEAVASILTADFETDKIYLSLHTVDEARGMLMNGINNGALYLNYVGHGGPDRLSNDSVLTTGDAHLMTNGSKLPVVVGMTCMIGEFDIPGYDGLGESLLMKQDGGAVAVWSPTGMSVDSEAGILDTTFFQRAASGTGKKVLGDLVLGALRQYRNTGKEPYIIDIYTILGDPALQIGGSEIQ